ncbi:MAG: hypothetical protein LAP87_26200 [Acidobacteriia bacterium]|nr:hypothetical protein [Terriglobia bacterium]
MDKSAQPIGLFHTQHTGAPSVEELAAQQGVTPIDDFDALLGEPLTGDESADEFSANLRAWRHEGTRSANPQ